jgi:hypothetical protein
MKTSNLTTMASATPPPGAATGANVLSRAIQGVCNFISGWRDPGEPMFDFTDDYFTQLPVASGETSSLQRPGHDFNGFDVQTWLREGTAQFDRGLPRLRPQRLSLAGAAWLGLAVPGLGSVLSSMGPPPIGAGACGLFCFPSAGAELLPQRHVSWAPVRHGAPAAMAPKLPGPPPDVVKINMPPPARRLPSAPGAPTFLADAVAWNDDVVSRLAQDQLQDFMGALPRDQWQAYLRLRSDIRSATGVISRQFNIRVTLWEEECVRAINKAINAKLGSQVGEPLDCRTAWLHTDYLEITSRSPRALAEGQPVRRRRSVTLWDAARQGFSYAVAWQFGAGRDFAAASFISRDQAGWSRVNALGVAAFADVVRTVDPGMRATRIVDELVTPGSVAWRRLYDLQADTVAFDIMDAGRSPATTGVDASARVRLLGGTTAPPGNRDWRRYRAEFGFTSPSLGVGRWVQLPFFTYDVDGVGVVAHAMGCPEYPLRVFPDRAKAEAWLTSSADLSAPWLHAQLSGDDRARAVAVRRSLAETGQPLPGLNPVAALLRDTVTALFPAPKIELVVDDRRVRLNGPGMVFPWTLQSPANGYAQSRITANAARLATPSGQLDWAYAREAGWRMASEILEILVTPVPGGVAGLNRLRTVAFGGFIGMGFAQGAIDASRGDAAPGAGAVMDILDLAFSLGTGRMAARAELRQAGYRRVPLGNARDGLWRFNADAMIRPHMSMVKGQQPANDGVIHVLGNAFVRLEQPPGTLTVLAASHGSDGRWRLRPRDAADYAPAIKRSGDNWVLDLDETPRQDVDLLSRLFSRAGLPASADVAVQMQQLTGVTREELDAVWRGEAPPSWFNGAATRVAIRDIINRLLSTSPGHGDPVHAIGEAFYAQFLADTLGKQVHVVDDNGVTAYLLNPATGQVPRGTEFMLYRQPGGCYGAQRDSPRGERVGIPGMLDVALAEMSSLGTSRVRSAGASASQARRQVVNAASDAWVRRHARAIERACLWAFELEASRTANPFLAAGQVAAGHGEPAGDISAEMMLTQLQYRYPGLTRADAVAILADQTLGPLARGEPDADDLASVLDDLRSFSRIVAARFRALAGQYDADSEALLLTGLTAHPEWPADRFIEVFQGGVDARTGEVVSHGVSVAKFGQGSQRLIMVRTPAGSHRLAHMEDTAMVVSTQHGPQEVSLIERVIQALPQGDNLHLRSLDALRPAAIVASMDMKATLKVLTDAAAHGIRASAPLDAVYAAPITSEAFPNGPTDGYFTAFMGGATRHFVKVDDIMARAVPEPGEPRRAHLLQHAAHSIADEPGAPEIRLDRQGHWRVVRVGEAVRNDLADWESAGGFSRPSSLQIPMDGMEAGTLTSATGPVLVSGGERVKAAFDFDFQAWRAVGDRSRVFRRAGNRWHEGPVAGMLDEPTHFQAIRVPAIPVPPADATPLRRTISYGWTGFEAPSASWLAQLRKNAGAAHESASGWYSRLHIDLDDAAQVQALKATLASQHVDITDLRRDRDFIAWLKTPAGRLYTAARNGAHPCYAAAMDVLRFGWILKRHGGLYLDMDDAILSGWKHVGELRTGPFQLLSGGPVNQALLGLEWDINTSPLGSHAGNPLLDRVIETMVDRAAEQPGFFDEPPGDAESFGRRLSALTGPGVLRDVLAQHAPEIPGLVEAMRVLKNTQIRYEALELAVAEAAESYFPLADVIETGHKNSWAPPDA